MRRPLVLCLDGSTGVCSAALVTFCPHCESPGGSWEIAASRVESDSRGQARLLLGLIDHMLWEVGAEPAALSAVLVGTGPGTFTGVRITVATARALALALAIPVLGVSTPSALAAAEADRAGAHLLVPVVDARRGQLFYALYIPGEAARGVLPGWERQGVIGVCDRADLLTRIHEAFIQEEADPRSKGTVCVIGEDRSLVSDLAPNMYFSERPVRAEHLLLGQERLREPGLLPEGDRLQGWLLSEACEAGPEWGSDSKIHGVGTPGTPESVKPIYVRSPDADVHITKMRDPWAPRSKGS